MTEQDAAFFVARCLCRRKIIVEIHVDDRDVFVRINGQGSELLCQIFNTVLAKGQAHVKRPELTLIQRLEQQTIVQLRPAQTIACSTAPTFQV